LKQTIIVLAVVPTVLIKFTCSPKSPFLPFDFYPKECIFTLATATAAAITTTQRAISHVIYASIM